MFLLLKRGEAEEILKRHGRLLKYPHIDLVGLLLYVEVADAALVLNHLR
jgi:hypothetical protein